MINPFYDEAYSNGELRAPYRVLHRQLLTTDKRRQRHRCREARRFFHGDADLLAWPRILTPEDFRTINRGVLQRGHALRAFLTDHYFGAPRTGHPPLIGPAKLTAMIRRAGEEYAAKILQPENIQFWYAPDLIRDCAGNFRVVEDNTGFVGGMGDLLACESAAAVLTGKSRPEPSPAAKFYRQLANYYLAQAKIYGGKKVILISYPPDQRVTHEDERLVEIFERFGITNVTEFSECTFDSRGMFYRGQRVGFIILNRDAADLDPESPTTYPRYRRNLINETGPRRRKRLTELLLRGRTAQLDRELRRIFGAEFSRCRRPAREFIWDAVRRKKLGISYPHGLEFVNDKQFYIYVEDLIRFYLREEPILRSIETHSFSGHGVVARVFSDIDGWVVKEVGGKGGEHVWLGPKLSAAQSRTLRQKVELLPAHYIAQRYIEPSRLLNHSVDLRPFALITPQRHWMCPVLWGRAIKSGSHGKVNISAGGKLNAIMVAQTER